jgi:hypothetical protein
MIMRTCDRKRQSGWPQPVASIAHACLIDFLSSISVAIICAVSKRLRLIVAGNAS